MTSIRSTKQDSSVAEPTSDVLSPISKMETRPSFGLKGYLSQTSKTFPTASTMSLKQMIARRSSLKSVSSSLSIEMDKGIPRKDTTPMEKDIDYGYGLGYGPGEPGNMPEIGQEPAMKRKRYQRRNSKTPQMLMAMNSSLLSLDFLQELDSMREGCNVKSHHDDVINENEIKKESLTAEMSSDRWDGGLVLAEELVLQLQKRRRSRSSRTINAIDD
jgi:hypothetical protein